MYCYNTVYVEELVNTVLELWHRIAKHGVENKTAMYIVLQYDEGIFWTYT